MNNNYNSKNNSDKRINDNDNDTNNITSLILVNNVFSHHAFNELDNLFQTEGLIHDRLFCPMVVLREERLA